jgi:hypothetical protein
MDLPSRRDFPDYYEMIDAPISLNQIRKKVEKARGAGYKSMDEFRCARSACDQPVTLFHSLYKEAFLVLQCFADLGQPLTLDCGLCTLDSCSADVGLISSNCLEYNTAGSEVCDDAIAVVSAILAKLDAQTAGRRALSPSPRSSSAGGGKRRKQR